MDQQTTATAPQSTTPPPAETPPISTPPKPNKKLLFILIGLLAILFAIGGAFAFSKFFLKLKLPFQPTQLSPTPVFPTPTPDPTANWKTYTDTEAKFLIKYPSDWQVYPIFPTVMSENVAVGKLKLIGKEGLIEITYGDGFGGGDCNSLSGALIPVTINNITVNVCQVVSSVGIKWRGSCGDCTAIKNGKTSYAVDADIMPITNNDNQRLMMQILSTFKFLD